jgi:DNA-binding transcriptional LysR family regulator
MLDLRRLKVFREVAQRGSFSATATELNFSPSAVGQQIAQLEREVGARLVERKSTGVALTPAGQRLLAHANAILARAADAEEDLRQLTEGRLGRLRMAAFATAASALMPTAMVEFRAVQPRIAVVLAEQNRDESLVQLRAGELDLAVVARSSKPEEEVGVTVVPLMDDYIDVLLPCGHPLADAPAVSLQELRDDRWADCAHQPVRQQLAALAIEPNVAFDCDNDRVIEGIVASGEAVALWPRLALPVASRDVVVKPIAPGPPVRRVAIAIRDRDRQPEYVTRMVEILYGVAAARTRHEKAAPSLEASLHAGEGNGAAISAPQAYV